MAHNESKINFEKVLIFFSIIISSIIIIFSIIPMQGRIQEFVQGGSNFFSSQGGLAPFEA